MEAHGVDCRDSTAHVVGSTISVKVGEGVDEGGSDGDGRGLTIRIKTGRPVTLPLPVAMICWVEVGHGAPVKTTEPGAPVVGTPDAIARTRELSAGSPVIALWNRVKSSSYDTVSPSAGTAIAEESGAERD